MSFCRFANENNSIIQEQKIILVFMRKLNAESMKNYEEIHVLFNF